MTPNSFLELSAGPVTQRLQMFTDMLQKPILMVPIANHDDLQHALAELRGVLHAEGCRSWRKAATAEELLD